jgi:hypothetical protein
VGNFASLSRVVERVLVAIESHQLDLILSAQTKTMLVPISNALSYWLRGTLSRSNPHA